MMTALNIPITVMLLGIVLRGSAFVFRKYDVKDERRWNTLFAIASFLTPFFQGVILGALTTGQIRVEQGRVLTGFMTGWLTPFALSCGVFALGLFAFLAATYLTLDTRDEPDLQEDFRRRSLSGSEEDHQGNGRKRQPGPQRAPAKIVLQVRFVVGVESQISGCQKREQSKGKHPA